MAASNNRGSGWHGAHRLCCSGISHENCLAESDENITTAKGKARISKNGGAERGGESNRGCCSRASEE